MRHNAFALLIACILSLSCAPLFAQQLTPAQAAYLKAETRKADEAFVKQVALITGVHQSDVNKALPDAKRITDPVAHLIASLESRSGKPLSEDQKTQIRAADAQRQTQLDLATANARKR